MAILDRLFGNNTDYDEDESYLYGDEDDDEDDEDEDEDDNPTGYGDDDDNPDGFGGSPEVDPNAMPFDDEDYMNDDGEDEFEESSQDGKSKKKKKKDKEVKVDEKGKAKVKVNKNSSKAELKKNAVAYGCLPHPEGYCPFCKQLSMFKSARFGDLMLVEGPTTLARAKLTTFYCMNKGCKHNWRSGWCVRCAGERYVGKKMPMKRVLNKD